MKRYVLKYISNTGFALYISIGVLAAPTLSGCSTYRINRLKNKSYKEWKANQEKDPENTDSNQRKTLNYLNNENE